jgi:hypothetical protein
MAEIAVHKKNKRKPSEKQRKFFDELQHARSIREAAIKAGYSTATSINPKENIIDSVGFKMLLDQHREDLRKAGVNTKLLAEIQALGLLDPDARVRLEYVKEAKKDLGIYQPDNKPSNIIIGIGLNKKDYSY